MRTFDPSVHHTIANHPEVVRNLGWNPDTQGVLLFSNEIADERYVFLHSGERDLTMTDILAGATVPGLAIIFEWTSPETFAMHTMSLPDFRGKKVIGAAKALIHEMFTDYGAQQIWGHTPVENRAARIFNRLVGAASYGVRDHFVIGRSEVFGNRRDKWLRDHWKPR